MNNRELERRMLQRGWLRTVKELEARQRIVESNQPMYSTEQAAEERRDEDKNRGTIAASNQIRSRSPFDEDRQRLGRTRFHTAMGEVFSFEQPRMRVMKK